MKELIKVGTVFHRGRFTYIVSEWNAVDQMWVCYSPNAQIVQEFTSKRILSFMGV